MNWRLSTAVLTVIALAVSVGCGSPAAVEISPSLDGDSTAESAGPSGEDSTSSTAAARSGGSTANPSAARPESVSNSPLENQGTIGYSALTLTNPFFVVIADNLKQAAAEHGYEVAVDDADRDVRRQAEQIDAYITRGVSAIVINPCDRKSIGPAIKKANEAGIPVFTCDLQCVAAGAEITGHVGTDNFQGGELAGQAMIEALGDAGGKVLILHFKQANSCVLRVKGFRQVIQEYNSGRQSGRIEIVSELEGGGLRDPAYNATSAALQTHPDLAGIFAINDPSALGAYTALEQAGKVDQVTIVAFDGQLEGKQAIKAGKIYADPIQFPDKMGRQTVEKIIKYLNGEDFEQVTLIPTQLYRQQDALEDAEISDL